MRNAMKWEGAKSNLYVDALPKAKAGKRPEA